MNQSGIDANESVTHRSAGPMRRIHLQHYALAILSVGVALGISLLLQHFGFRVPSALLLLFAVAISSWYAGAGPAVLAAILATISFYWYFVEPVHTIYINRSEIPYFVIFTAFAALLSRFGTFRQHAEADLRRTHDQLKVERPKLGSRTIALLYFAFSSCWILFTDRLVHGLGLSSAYLLKVSEAKGILFISLSTLLMYVLVEKALRQRHSVATAYWQLVETAQEGVWSVDAEGKTVFANENMAAILGTSPGEMIGKSILPFVPQEKKDELLNHLLLREQGLQEHYEFPFLRADGAQVWTLLRVSPVLTDGQHSGCLALVSDITKRKHAEEALRRSNRELRAISNCNQALLHATDERSLLDNICRIVCEEAGYRMAFVAFAEHDDAKTVRPVAWTGAEEGYLATAGITWADTESGRGQTGTAIRSGKTCCIQDFATDPRLAPWREGLLQRGFRSGIALPLKDENDNAFGSLTIHSAQPNAFTSEEVRLLEELAGDLAFGIVTLRSRSARKQAEQALRQSEAYLAEAQRLTHTGAWATDAVPEPLYWSEELYRLYGLDSRQGFPTHEQAVLRVHPEDRDRYVQAFHRVIHQKVDSDVEFRTVLPDGTIRYLYGLGHPILNTNGDVVEVVGTTVDITERKRAEEALRESETRFRTFVDHAGDALLVYDLEHRTVVDVNRSACESLGYTRQELIGKTPHAFHLDSHQKEMESTAARAAAGETVFDRHMHRRKDGSTFPVEVHTSLVSYGGRRFLLKVARDITDRVRAEEQRDRLRLLESEIAHIDRVNILGELAASISHELNQPITASILNASLALQWLERDPPDLSQARHRTEQVIEMGTLASEIIDRLRSLYKKEPPKRGMLTINEVIGEMVVLLRGEAIRHAVSLRADLADNLPFVNADRVQIQQVLMNLMLNGIEAMSDTGGILTVKSQLKDDGQIEISVNDTGSGLPPGKAGQIFDAFFTTKPQGSGMGLAISKSIVESHGGRIWANGNGGRGATFHFTLPVALAEGSLPAVVD